MAYTYGSFLPRFHCSLLWVQTHDFTLSSLTLRSWGLNDSAFSMSMDTCLVHPSERQTQASFWNYYENFYVFLDLDC